MVAWQEAGVPRLVEEVVEVFKIGTGKPYQTFSKYRTEVQRLWSKSTKKKARGTALPEHCLDRAISAIGKENLPMAIRGQALNLLEEIERARSAVCLNNAMHLALAALGVAILKRSQDERLGTIVSRLVSAFGGGSKVSSKCVLRVATDMQTATSSSAPSSFSAPP